MTSIRKSDYIAFVEGVRYQDGEIAIDNETIDGIQGSALVVFKRVFDPRFLTDLRKTVVGLDYKHHDYAVNADGRLHNFSRWDDLLHRERRACKNMGYNLYHWNSETPNTVNSVRSALTRFGNEISGRVKDARLTEDDEKIGTIAGTYYPSGGCLISHHFSDDIVGERNEAFDEMIVLCSKYGRDYHEGGLYVAPRFRLSEFDDPSNYGELRFMEEDIDEGDVLAFTIKDCYHRVEPIDPHADTPFDPMTGRFLFAFYYGRQQDFEILAANAGQESLRKGHISRD